MAQRPRKNATGIQPNGGATVPDATSGTDGNPQGNGSVENGANGDSGIVNPESLYSGGSTNDGTADAPKRGRGRPKGSGNKSKEAPSSGDIGALTAIILSLHVGLAYAAPEMELEKAEAEMVAAAIVRVERHYQQV